MLCFTGLSRIASEVARSTIDNLEDRARELVTMRGMVEDALRILQDPDRPLADFGALMHEGWRLKRGLSDQVSTPAIDRFYETARDAGATGGKLLGAGGGGFMLLFVAPERQASVRAALKDLIHVPFGFDEGGSRVVLYQPNGLH
jgi:D-glycero-alpha-D-manno-heptose-7-phosphate kinase